MKHVRASGTLAGLAAFWAAGLSIHLLLRLPDVRLWLAVPLLILPWRLFGPFDP